MPNKPEKRNFSLLLLFLVVITTALSTFAVGSWFSWGRGSRNKSEPVNASKANEISYNMQKSFDSINVGTIQADITISPEDSEIVKINGDNGLDKEIKLEVRGNTLYISSSNKLFNWSNQSVSIELGIEKLRDITVSGSTGITSSGELSGKNVSITSSGTGNIDLGLTAENITLTSSGVCNVTLTGEASNSMRIQSSGTGKFDCSEFIVSECRINASGMADITVNAKDDLDIKASGAAVINYYGSPSINKSVSGLVQVNKLD